MALYSWFQRSGLKLFPLYNTLRNYSVSKGIADARAAVNVSMLDFTQGMAYALIAGLPVQNGIFGSALSSISGPTQASSRFVMLGPTNATAVMLLSTFLTLGYAPEQAVLVLPVLLLMVGLFMIGGAFLRIASVTQFISRAVVVGYISAAACLIIVNQLKNVLGLEVPRSGTFVGSLSNLLSSLHSTQLSTVLIAVITLVIFLPLRRWAKALPNVAVTLVAVGFITQFVLQYGVTTEMLDPIRISTWKLTVPQASFSEVALLANAALALAFLSLLESASISKTLAAQAGDRIDLNQQMLSIGTANIICAFGGGMAASGSLTRSVLNFKSGAKTALSSVFSGCLLIGGLFLLGPYIAYIPKAALATLVIVIGCSLINPANIRVMLKTTRSDAVVFSCTFISGLFLPLDTAIYIGAATSIAFFLHKASKPDLKEISFDDGGNVVEQNLATKKEERPEIAIVHVEGDLFFASTELFLQQMRNLVEHPALKIIVLRLRNAHNLDATIALTLKDLVVFARKNNRDVIVSGAHPDIERVFRNSGLLAVLTEENFFRYHPENPTISTRDALKRAQQITGTDKADIKIYANAEKKNNGDS
jgi:SulP family sulfate permease